MAAQFDLVVRNGTVLDGTGGEPREADVAIQDGRIAAVGRIAGAGREEIDAKGLAVTPGFVDIHTHYDGQVTWDERFTPSSGHGVTTVLMGNCGVGFAPCRPAGPRHADQGHGRRRGHPRGGDARRRAVELAELPRLSRCAGRAALRHRLRHPGAARAAARLRHGRARRRPRAGDGRRTWRRWRARRGRAGGRRARLLDLALAVPSHARRRAHAHHHRRPRRS